MTKRFPLTLTLLACLAVIAAAASSPSAGTKNVLATVENWNQFRGPNGDGKSLARNLPVEFSETKNVRWKIPIHDEGWSSPVVWGNQIWLTTGRVEGSESFGNRGKGKPEKKKENAVGKGSKSDKEELIAGMRAKGTSDQEIKEWFAESKANSGKKGTAVPGKKKKVATSQKRSEGNLELFAIAVDLETGNIIHDIKVFDAKPQMEWGGENTHASPTPVVEDGRIYVHYGAYGTACLDTKTGKKLWENREFKCDHRVRPASSPIVDASSLFLQFDGVDAQFVAALNKRTGETRWLKNRTGGADLGDMMRSQGWAEADIERTRRLKPADNRKSYATPTIIEYQGKRQLISPAAEMTFAYDPATGAELWRVRHPGMGFNVTSRPIFVNGLVYSTTGMSRHMMAVRPSGTGDVTDTHLDWFSKGKDTPHMPSPVIVDGLMFLVTDEGFASCRELKTGKRLWRKRLRAGGQHWASPVYADGKVYFTGKNGVVTVVAAEREFQLLAESKFDGNFHAAPAIAGDAIILRSFTDLYCIAQAAKSK